MSQSGREQPDEAPRGTEESIASLSDSVLTALENPLREFGNIAVSVSVMNKSITVLLTELDELKSQKLGTECRRELVEQPQSEPLINGLRHSKWIMETIRRIKIQLIPARTGGWQ